MRPFKPLPYSDEFSSPDDYVSQLLDFSNSSEYFQILCGGVHILDFFTQEPGLFSTSIPPDWQEFLLKCEPMALIDLLIRENIDSPGENRPPDSLVEYIRTIRRFSLARDFTPRNPRLAVLPRSVALGMKTKKIHEVTHFAGYVDALAEEVARLQSSPPEKDGNDGEATNGARVKPLTHFVDFGSGQNYLGRALASPPYNRHVVAVESREVNMSGARNLDILAKMARAEKIVRNKKVVRKILDAIDPAERDDEDAWRRTAERIGLTDTEIATIDLRRRSELQTTYTAEEGKGFIHYVIGHLENADLSDVVVQLGQKGLPTTPQELRMMAVSIHSCGNLSHYGIRSLIANPTVQAVAIVGCCYNRMTEKLGPPTYKMLCNRPSLQAVNGRVVQESERRDPQGFPLSERFSTHGGRGIRLNITARMMACQAPRNWTEKESDGFFDRHFYRAMLQRIFLDRGVISRVLHNPADGQEQSGTNGVTTPFNSSTNPVIIGTLHKSCYSSLRTYVRGAIARLTSHAAWAPQYGEVVADRMAGLTDGDIDEYERQYGPRKRELSAVWSLMAFSAVVVESLIVTDRWQFLREYSPDVVRDCWVDTVFDFRESPRNLVVVGIKR